MTFQTDDRARIRRQRTERAIKLAMESKWEEAAHENQLILSVFSKDVDAHNRLGKALTELGRYADARASYGRAIELDPNNAIARKNLQRLQSLGEVAPPAGEGRQKVDPDLFIEETGKTGITQLQRPNRDGLRLSTAGDKVELQRRGNGILVESSVGEYLGMVEPRLALRLARLMDSGNEYAAAVASISPNAEQGRIIIKETLQSPENIGRLSFPTTGPGSVRPYTKESLLRYDLGDDEGEGDEENEGGDSWDEDSDSDSGPEVSLDARRESEINDDDRSDYED